MSWSHPCRGNENSLRMCLVFVLVNVMRIACECILVSSMLRWRVSCGLLYFMTMTVTSPLLFQVFVGRTAQLGFLAGEFQTCIYHPSLTAEAVSSKDLELRILQGIAKIVWSCHYVPKCIVKIFMIYRNCQQRSFKQQDLFNDFLLLVLHHGDKPSDKLHHIVLLTWSSYMNIFQTGSKLHSVCSCHWWEGDRKGYIEPGWNWDWHPHRSTVHLPTALHLLLPLRSTPR